MQVYRFLCLVYLDHGRKLCFCILYSLCVNYTDLTWKNTWRMAMFADLSDPNSTQRLLLLLKKLHACTCTAGYCSYNATSCSIGTTAGACHSVLFASSIACNGPLGFCQHMCNCCCMHRSKALLDPVLKFKPCDVWLPSDAFVTVLTPAMWGMMHCLPS